MTVWLHLRRFLVGIYRDRARVFLALIAAVMLWYIIGEKVETEGEFTMAIVAVPKIDASAVDMLFLKVPDSLVLERTDPSFVKVAFRGTKEDLDRFDKRNGVWEIPPDFCGGADRTRKQVNVGDVFQFSGIRSLRSLRILGQPSFEISLARRAETDVTLSLANLEVDPGLIPEDADLECRFLPSTIRVSGAIDVIRALDENAARLKVHVDTGRFQLALRDVLTVHGNEFALDASTDNSQRVVVEDVGDIRIQLVRKQQFRTVKLESVPVNWLIPKAAWREGADLKNPLKLSAETVSLEIQLPIEEAQSATLEADLRARLNVFVNLLEMPFTVEADKLPVHVEGLAKGALVTPIPARIDVEWRKKVEGGSADNR